MLLLSSTKQIDISGHGRLISPAQASRLATRDLRLGWAARGESVKSQSIVVVRSVVRFVVSLVVLCALATVGTSRMEATALAGADAAAQATSRDSDANSANPLSKTNVHLCNN